MLCLVSTAVAGNLPWREAIGRTAPFADVLVDITGVPAVRLLFLVTAFVGAVGVMNSTLYSAARMMYGLAQFDLVSRWFDRLHPKYGTPTRCIWFTASFVLLAPFTGKLFFLPLINIASLATIVMWVMTLAAVLWLRKKYPDLHRPVYMPADGPWRPLVSPPLCFSAQTFSSPSSPGRLAHWNMGWPLSWLWWALCSTTAGTARSQMRSGRQVCSAVFSQESPSRPHPHEHAGFP